MDACMTGRVVSRSAISYVDGVMDSLRSLREQDDLLGGCMTTTCHGSMGSYEGRRRSVIDYEGALLDDAD